MNRTLLLASATMLVACAGGTPPADRPGAGEPGLQARILKVGKSVTVQTNRHAYVAVFEILPGRGVDLLYPAFRGQENLIAPGRQLLFLSNARAAGSTFRAVDVRPTSSEERHVYLVASERPLRLEAFTGSTDMLATAMGFASYAAVSRSAVLERVNELVLPERADEQWASDLHTTSDDRARSEDLQFIRVTCEDGTTVTVSVIQSRTACLARGRPESLRPAPSAPPAQPEPTSAPIRS